MAGSRCCWSCCGIKMIEIRCNALALGGECRGKRIHVSSTKINCIARFPISGLRVPQVVRYLSSSRKTGKKSGLLLAVYSPGKCRERAVHSQELPQARRMPDIERELRHGHAPHLQAVRAMLKLGLQCHLKVGFLDRTRHLRAEILELYCCANE